MKYKSVLLLAGVVLLMGAATATQAQVTFNGASLTVEASATVFDGVDPNQTTLSSDSDSAAHLPTPALSVETSASESVPLAGTANSTIGATATFASPYAGTIEFIGNASANVIAANGQAFVSGDGSIYDYHFDVSQPGSITISYSDLDLGDVPSDIGSDIYLFNNLGNPPDISDTLANSTGSLTFELTPTQYTLQIEDGAALDVLANGPESQTASEDHRLSFSITSSAPEPMTWALMLLGIGGAGLALRRANGTYGSSFARGA